MPPLSSRLPLLAVLLSFASAAAAAPAGAATPAANLLAVACPTTSQCTAIGTGRDPERPGQVTFNPAAPGHPTGVLIGPSVSADDSVAMEALACASVSLCVGSGVIGHNGQPQSSADAFLAMFDPTGQGQPSTVAVKTPNDPNANILMGIACPSATQCTAVGGSSAVTFNPAAPGAPAPVIVDPNTILRSVSCPSVSVCVAVGQDANQSGQLVAFDPASPAAARHGTTPHGGPGTGLTAVSCATTSQCTATSGMSVTTFNPAALASAQQSFISGSVSFFEIACPTTSECALAGIGKTIGSGDGPGQDAQGAVFNPAAPGNPSSTEIDAQALGGTGAFACPSATQCTGVDGGGREVTYNPAAPGNPVPVFVGNFPASSGPGSISPGQAASTALAPSGSAAKIGSLLQAGGCTLGVSAPSAGTMRTAWYRAGSGARAAKLVLIASGSTRFSKPGVKKLKIKLSSTGKRLLKHAKSVKLTAVASFTPAGAHKAVTKRKTFTVKR